MSIESSNNTPIRLSTSTRRAAFLVHPTSADLRERDFVAFFPGSDKYIIRVANEADGFGQVVTGRLTKAGSDCPVEVAYLYGGGSGGGGGGPETVTTSSYDSVTNELTITHEDGVPVVHDLTQEVECTVACPGEAITGTSGTFLDGTTYTVTGGSPFTLTPSGDITQNTPAAGSPAVITFSSPVNVYITNADGSSASDPWVWDAILPDSTQFITDGDDWVFQDNFGGNIVAASPKILEGTPGLSTRSQDAWGFISSDNVTTLSFRARSADTYNFTFTPAAQCTLPICDIIDDIQSDISDLQASSGSAPTVPTIQSGSVAGSDLILTLDDSSTITVDMSTFIDDTNLARIISAAVTGTDVTFTRDDSTTFDVDLSAFVDDTNLARILTGSVVGSNIELVRDDASVITVDISSLEEEDWLAVGGVKPNSVNNDIYTQGFVGIKQTTPDRELVIGQSNGGVIKFSDSNQVTTTADMLLNLQGLIAADTNFFIQSGADGLGSGDIDFIFGAEGTTGSDRHMKIEGPTGNVGIGTGSASPADRLEIDSEVANDSGLTFTRIDSSTGPTPGAAAIGVDANGKVVLVPSAVPATVVVSEPDQIVNLAANTPLVVTTTVITDLKNIQLTDSAGKVITSGVDIIYTSGTTFTLESNIPLTGVVVKMVGL